MSTAYWIILLCGALAVVYGAYAIRAVLSVSAGNERMREIALAIQEGANAYLNRQYTTIAVVGVTLGLGFGGGLLIKEVRTGSIPRHDVFGVLVLINLLHSVFEDTAVVMLLGPSLLVILGGRFLFTMLVVWIMMRITSPLPDKVWRSMLTNNNVPEKAG